MLRENSQRPAPHQMANKSGECHLLSWHDTQPQEAEATAHKVHLFEPKHNKHLPLLFRLLTQASARSSSDRRKIPRRVRCSLADCGTTTGSELVDHDTTQGLPLEIDNVEPRRICHSLTQIRARLAASQPQSTRTPEEFARSRGRHGPPECIRAAAKTSSIPLGTTRDLKALGVVQLQDDAKSEVRRSMD